MIEIYEYNNHIMIFSGYSEPVPHKHAAAHIFLSENEMQIHAGNDEYSARGIVIPSGIVHSVDNNGLPVLVFMLDETTSAAEQIKNVETITGDFVDQLFQKFRAYKEHGRSSHEYIGFIRALYMHIGIDES